LSRYSAEGIRAFVLSSHYRGPVDFTHEAVAAAEQGAHRILNTVRRVRAQRATPPDAAEGAPGDPMGDLVPYRDAFVEAMDDDLNTARALGTLHELARDVNRWLDGGRVLDQSEIASIDNLFTRLGGDVLGVIPDRTSADGAREAEALAGVMEILLQVRQRYREAREWGRADALRDELSELGIAIEDRPDGATWRMETR
jgi:cysteinyl-tRNA synthetase